MTFSYPLLIIAFSDKNNKQMAIIDVVKCDMQDGELCYKFPSDNLRIGTQVVVYPAQTAFFVKGGTVCDEFTSGTYIIKTENIPLLHKIINIPFGGDSPFKADVWLQSLTFRGELRNQSKLKTQSTKSLYLSALMGNMVCV